MQLTIDGKEVGLKVSMWVLDNDRVSNMLNEQPQSIIWKFVSYFYIAHLNFCRYTKSEPVVSSADLELFVDEQISSELTRDEFQRSFTEFVNEITAMGGNDEKKIPLAETEQAGNL